MEWVKQLFMVLVAIGIHKALKIKDAGLDTEAIVICGEISGSAEEEATECGNNGQKCWSIHYREKFIRGQKMGQVEAIVSDGRSYDTSKR